MAEVLITLGIIGVVAAMTLPTLISKYQKHVWYTQFRKAATVLENAINQYNFDHACGGPDRWGDYDNLCVTSESNTNKSAADKLSQYMNVVQWITEDNYEDVCKGYKKLPPTMSYDGKNRPDEYSMNICADAMYGRDYYDKGYGFITSDGMLFSFGTDDGFGGGSTVDTNGPDKGPNIYGRDIFVFYLHTPVSNRWGVPYEDDWCFGDNKAGWNCGIRLLQEGKMNY